MKHRSSLSLLLSVPMLLLLVIPVLALLLSSSPGALWAGMQHPLFRSAFLLSVQTSFVSLLLIVVLGTPLAWWLSVTSPRRARACALLVDLPIVLPPAVLGIALLQAFGRSGRRLDGRSAERATVRRNSD